MRRFAKQVLLARGKSLFLRKKCASSTNFYVLLPGALNMDTRYQALIRRMESHAMIAHEDDQPTEKLRQAIARFAKGSVTAEERAELCLTLQKRPEWVPLLAEEVRLLRRDGG